MKLQINGWVLSVAALILAGFIAYANSFSVPFAYDDLETILTTTRIESYSHWSNLQFLKPRSLTYATFALNYGLGGQHVLGYHVINLLLHLFNGLLIFGIAVRIFKRVIQDPLLVRVYALLSASLFLVHPVQTESVTYISSRSELLATFFYLLAFFFFVMLPEKGIGFFAAAVVSVCLLLGLGGKEIVVTLPAVILLYDWLFLSHATWKSLLSTFPRWRFYLFFVAGGALGAYYAVTKDILGLNELEGPAGNYPRWNYLITQPRVIARYLRLLVVPTGLNLDYDFGAYISAFQLPVLLPLLLIVGLIIAGWMLRRTKPVFTFSIFWFFITLSPRSSIQPIQDLIAEHRLYLPLAGACLSFPFIIEWIVSLSSKWAVAIKARHSKAVLVSAAGVLLVFTTLTLFRNQVWRDEVRLWTDVVAKSPHKLRPYNRLIYGYMQRGQIEKALSVANLGLGNVPVARVAFLDTIGNLYLKMGQPDQAVLYFRRSTEEAVRTGTSGDFKAGYFSNLGTGYMAWSKLLDQSQRALAWRRAQEAFAVSIGASEKNIATLDSFVNVSYLLGDGPQLEREFIERLKAQPGDFWSVYSLAALLSLEGRYMDSLGYFGQAEGGLSFKRSAETLYFNYALALSKAGQPDKAIQKYLQALRIDPDFSEAHYNLALLYIGKQDYNSAVQHLATVLGKDPAHARANITLARIYAYQGKWVPARERLRQVLRVDPNNPQAVALLQQIPGQ